MSADEYSNPTQSNDRDNYRAEVQNRVQDLVSGTRPRDPRLSSFSTRRLILEAVVEELRIYRIRRQKEAMEMVERQRKAERHRHRHHHHHDRDGDHGGHRHRHRHRHHDDDEERHHRYRSRSGHRDERRHERRERSRSRRRRQDRELPDPVTQGQPYTNPDFMMTGGAGPARSLHAEQAPRERSTSPSHPLRRQAGVQNLRQAPDNTTISEAPPRAQTPHPRPRSQFRHARRRVKKPSAALLGLYHPPQRQLGPDGVTPFGSVPSKAVGVGLATHILNTYRHIKAEHDAGHRARGVLERTVDGWRGKGGNGKSTQAEKHRGRKHGKDREAPQRMYRGVSEDEWRGIGDGRGKVWTGGKTDLPMRPRSSPGPAVPPKDDASRASSMEVQFTPPRPPVAPYNNERSVWRHQPERLHAPQPAKSFNPSLLEVAQTGFPPPSPPPPPLPPTPMPASAASPLQPLNPPSADHPSTDHASLLSQIRKAPALRKVPASQVKDKSTSSAAGNVYEATEHSRDVEERERREEDDVGDGASEVGSGDGEEEVQRRRRLRRELGGGVKGRCG